MKLVRLANPIVRAVLRSRFHRLLSSRLLVLSYRGHRSNGMFDIPLRYVETPDAQLVVVAVRPERKLWWRSFREPVPAAVLLRGERFAVSGAVMWDGERASMLARYIRGRARVARMTESAAVVVFTLAPR